jgi:hypothetical protein
VSRRGIAAIERHIPGQPQQHTAGGLRADDRRNCLHGLAIVPGGRVGSASLWRSLRHTSKTSIVSAGGRGSSSCVEPSCAACRASTASGAAKRTATMIGASRCIPRWARQASRVPRRRQRQEEISAWQRTVRWNLIAACPEQTTVLSPPGKSGRFAAQRGATIISLTPQSKPPVVRRTVPSIAQAKKTRA